MERAQWYYVALVLAALLVIFSFIVYPSGRHFKPKKIPTPIQPAITIIMGARG